MPRNVPMTTATPLLTPRDIKAEALGFDLSTYTDAQIYRWEQRAERLVSRALGFSTGGLGFQVANDESQIVDPTLVFELNQGPIRAVQNVQLLYGAWGGQRNAIQVATTPVETPPVSGAPPIIFGQVTVDRTTNAILVNRLALYYIPLPFAFQAGTGLAQITYTVGWDDGTETDGVSFPAPPWLREALLLATMDIIADVQFNELVPGAVSSYRSGQFSVTKDAARGSASYLGQRVLDLLADHTERWSMA